MCVYTYIYIYIYDYTYIILDIPNSKHACVMLKFRIGKLRVRGAEISCAMRSSNSSPIAQGPQEFREEQ